MTIINYINSCFHVKWQDKYDPTVRWQTKKKQKKQSIFENSKNPNLEYHNMKLKLVFIIFLAFIIPYINLGCILVQRVLPNYQFFPGATEVLSTSRSRLVVEIQP